MTDQELRDLVASIAITQAETAEQMKETDRRMAKTDQLVASMSLEVKETAKQIKQVNKQLGEMGNKFGSFTEGLAWSSLDKIVKQQFGMDSAHRFSDARNGRSLEIDMLAYDRSGERNEAYVVEIKSYFKREDVGQLLRIISDLPEFASYTHGRKVYGMIAAVQADQNAINEAIKQGLYVVRIGDETFKLLTPANFKPKVFDSIPKQNGQPNGHVKTKKKKPRNK